VSLAWTTVVLLVLLLPGFLFFVGLYSHERVSRDVAPGSTLGELAGVVLISVVAHGILLPLIDWLAGYLVFLPVVSIKLLLSTLQLGSEHGPRPADLDAQLNGSVLWIVGYVILTSVTGFLGGSVVGRMIVRGEFRFAVKHAWVYDLLEADSAGGPVHAFVLTDVRQEEKVLMYRGFVKEFYVARDGTISYLVLKECQRYYMILAKKDIQTSATNLWQTIGSSHLPDGNAAEQRKWSWMVLAGKDVANVVFDAYSRVEYSDDGTTMLDEELQKMEEAESEAASEAPQPPAESAKTQTVKKKRTKPKRR
jgi:hypothetical protein